MPLDLVPHPQDEVLELIYSIQKASNFSNWSPALRAAPEAILVMAVCLRAASHPGAKAVDVGRSWEGLDGNVIKFPSQFLDTNLQHCSDLGRMAFREAESGMRKLQLNLDDMLGSQGTIRSIIRVLDRPNAAKYQLRGKMDDLQTSAADCKKNAEAIRDKFDVLLSYTMALYKATKSKQGETSVEQEQNTVKTIEEAHNVKAYERELDLLKEKKEKDIELLKQAMAAVAEAEAAVDGASNAYLNPEAKLTTADIERMVRETNLEYDSGDGFVGKGLRSMFGKSDKRRQRDQAEARELREARQSQTKELLKLQQEQVDDSRKQALLALEEARNIAVLRQKSLDETSNLWRVTSDALLKSAKSLDTSNRLLSQLGNEKLDLAKTKEIIETSLEHLTVFRHQIDSMLSYFTENAEYVEKLTAPTGQLGKILSTIEAISKASGNKDKARLMPNLEFDAEDKDELVQHALQLEGRFSAVYEIAGVYLEVSKKYIIPGINKMEELSLLGSRQYNERVHDFQKFCRDAKFEIEELSSTRGEKVIAEKVGRNMWLMAKDTKYIENKPYPEDGVDGDGSGDEDGQ